jgi:hypothetical protein
MPSQCVSSCLGYIDSPVLDYLLLYRKLVDDIVYEVDCQMVTVKAGADVDIGASTLVLAFCLSLTLV